MHVTNLHISSDIQKLFIYFIKSGVTAIFILFVKWEEELKVTRLKDLGLLNYDLINIYFSGLANYFYNQMIDIELSWKQEHPY